MTHLNMITVTGEPIVVLILGVIFTVLGLFFITKPSLVFKWQKWQLKKALGAELIPNKRALLMSRFTGTVFVIVGLLCLCLFFFADFQ